MKKFYELQGLQPNLNKESVLKAIDCYEDSPIYQEISEEYEEIKEEIPELIQPEGILGFASLPEVLSSETLKAGTPIVYAVMTIGRKVSQCSTEAFRGGDYVKGMLYDAMADEMLFSLENSMIHQLREACQEHKMGILKRLEAPHDIPMAVQKEAWEYLELEKRFGIGISSGFMYDPLKTSCQVFVLTEDEKTFKAQHDCRNCPNVNCRMRNIPEPEIQVTTEQETKKFFMKKGESLMEALLREGVYLSAPCGGNGRCGKCGVQVLKGKAPVTGEDEKSFSEKELEQGWRLSCRLYPGEDLQIALGVQEEKSFEILGREQEETEKIQEKELEYEIAVDIGTTTIAMSLLGISGKIYGTAARINSQRAYGADVISRIQASVDGKNKELRACIQKDLLDGIRQLIKEAEVGAEKIKRVILSGNTTMGHLLMGYDCKGLGVYPFRPVNIGLIRGSAEEILGSSELCAEVLLLPGISTYVGGDIVSGLYACGFEEKEEVSLLIDLGTNGEMALGNKERILVTSAAAGPAFEGGNITWGTGSIAGAICSVEICNGQARVQTIQEKPPVGICGTGVVETVTALLEEEIVEETGTMDEKYSEEGFPLGETEDHRRIVFTGKDVREIQLAKAAVRAGIETLLLRYGITKEEVSRVFLAGGFGYKLNKDKAITLGLLPEEFRSKIEPVGNSSLSGAIRYLREGRKEEILKELCGRSREINLSADRDFNEFYMEYMMFGEE